MLKCRGQLGRQDCSLSMCAVDEPGVSGLLHDHEMSQASAWL